MLVDICRSLARYGPKRFYALNTGVSTLRALPARRGDAGRRRHRAAIHEYARNGRGGGKGVRKEEGGTHADEIETSLMLFIDPASVDMSQGGERLPSRRR